MKEQTDLEVNILQDSLNNIRTTTARLEIASTALNDLALRPQGKKMIVPLTASLYVAGTLDDTDNLFVDVGTGYFIEVSLFFINFMIPLSSIYYCSSFSVF